MGVSPHSCHTLLQDGEHDERSVFFNLLCAHMEQVSRRRDSRLDRFSVVIEFHGEAAQVPCALGMTP